MEFDVARENWVGSTFTASIDFASVSGTSETPFLLIKNPSGSGKILLVTHMSCGVDSTITRTFFRLYLDPTITADGSAVGIPNLAAMDSAPSSAMEAYSSPTISANGTLVCTKLVSANMPSGGQSRYVSVAEGHSMLVTIQNSVTSINSHAQIYWVEP